MSRRIPASLRWTVLAALLGVVAIALVQSWVAAPSAADQGWTQSRWGPLGPADRDLLQKVRLAGLWEGPTGQQAEQQASSPAVKQVGSHLGHEHAQLDEDVRRTADQLGVLLPSRPSDQQIGWMNDLSARTGSDYDRQFVQILRAAHGQVLPLITQVRVGTRNDVMRRFATTADEFVTRHIGYLESTGLVDYSALPPPPDPAPAGGRSMSDLVVPGLVVLGALLAAGGLLTTLLRRSRLARQPSALRRLLPAARAVVPAPRPAPDGVVAPTTRPPLGPPDPWAELGDLPPTRPRAAVEDPDHRDGADPVPDPYPGVRRRHARTTPRSRS